MNTIMYFLYIHFQEENSFRVILKNRVIFLSPLLQV